MLTIKHIPMLLKFKSCYVLLIRNRDVASFLKEGECWGSDSSKMKILQPPPPHKKNPQKSQKGQRFANHEILIHGSAGMRV